MQYKISKFLFSAVIVCVLVFTALLVFQTEVYRLLSREDCVVEYLSSLFLFLSSFLFFKAFLHSKKYNATNKKWLPLVCITIAVLYFLAAGEEISWGQRIFNISTPDYLSAINDQNELNFHNINKRFFDRVLDRVTILFVLISSALFLLKKEVFFGIKKPDLFIICAFAITPFYRQNTYLDFYHLLYLPLMGLLIHAILTKAKRSFFVLLITLIIFLLVQITHTKYNYLFPSHNNSTNEFKEFLFCLCCLGYSYVILDRIQRDAAKKQTY